MLEEAIAPRTVDAGFLVTAQSFLIDRIKPDCEIIALPEKVMESGTLSWSVGPIEAVSEKGAEKGLRALISGGTQSVEIAPEDHWIIDLRANSPSNWAHFLNNHLPTLFAVANGAGLDPARALAILPADAPRYIQAAAALFNITFLMTNGSVKGHGVTCGIAPWGALRTARAGWVRLPAPQAALAAILAEPSPTPLPKKVFLTRKNTRTLSNISEIEGVLGARGFQTILPETLSPADQFRLFLNAEEIVAIHGAGLAPLLYSTPELGPKKLIELLPCGHMTDVYRVMASDVGCGWVGVRGRIKGEYIPHVYKTDKPAYVLHSMDSFEVDPVSLEYAFEISERQTAVATV